MIHTLLAIEESTGGSPLAALGVDLKSFIFQIITFVLVLVLLKRFAFKPISRVLAERRKVIDDGVRMGLKMEHEKAKLDTDVVKAMHDARYKADQIIADAQNDSKQIIALAEQDAKTKVDAMLSDADQRIKEQSIQAKVKLENELAVLISEATEAVVGKNIDAKKDAELILKSLNNKDK